MPSSPESSPRPEPSDPLDSVTGPNCNNACPELQQFDWWSEWRAVIGEEHLPDEPTEAEFDAWLEYRATILSRQITLDPTD